MSRSILFALTLAACAGGGDTSFTNTNSNEDEVQGSGDLSFSPAELVFTDLEVGITVSQFLTFSSIGEVNLNLYEVRVISTGNGTFYVPETEDLIIAPGNSLDVTVTATLADDNPAEGSLRVQTNDADYIEFTVPLFAYPVGYTPPEDSDTGA